MAVCLIPWVAALNALVFTTFMPSRPVFSLSSTIILPVLIPGASTGIINLFLSVFHWGAGGNPRPRRHGVPYME